MEGTNFDESAGKLQTLSARLRCGQNKNARRLRCRRFRRSSARIAASVGGAVHFGSKRLRNGIFLALLAWLRILPEPCHQPPRGSRPNDYRAKVSPPPFSRFSAKAPPTSISLQVHTMCRRSSARSRLPGTKALPSLSFTTRAATNVSRRCTCSTDRSTFTCPTTNITAATTPALYSHAQDYRDFAVACHR